MYQINWLLLESISRSFDEGLLIIIPTLIVLYLYFGLAMII